jgi:hypothetical protein
MEAWRKRRKVMTRENPTGLAAGQGLPRSPVSQEPDEKLKEAAD